jgi:hypothetical protein
LVDDGPPHMDEKPAAAPDALPKEKPGILTLWRRIWEIEGSPHAVAGGLAVGMFFGISPLWGLKTLLTLGTATVFRLNPLAAFLSLTAHDLLTPFVPVTLRLQYDLGYFLLSHPHHLPPKLAMADFHPAELMHWTTFFARRPAIARRGDRRGHSEHRADLLRRTLSAQAPRRAQSTPRVTLIRDRD